eukprot:6836280-Pyramimonas_sp.AAC.1
MARRIQRHEHAMGPIRRGILSKRSISTAAKVRYVEALACSRLLQQVEIWHDVGVMNEGKINAAYIKAMRAATGMVHTTETDEHFTDQAVLYCAQRPGLSDIRRIRRLKYIARVIHDGPATL